MAKNHSDSRLLELAVEHRFLAVESADRLRVESSESSMPAEVIALKSGALAPWQIEAIRSLGEPESVVPGYRVTGLLGRGGFGSVYKATQINMSRDVALKTIPMRNVRDSSTARRFEREAKIVGQLLHPHIVAAYDFGILEDRLFLTLELVDGQDLGRVLKQVGELDEATTWHIIRQTVTALAYAAEKDVTHRDIKPANLLVAKPPLGYSLPSHVPFVKVSDFGLACFKETRGEEGITLENAGLGTPSFVAPEQLRGSGVDERADIYSLGATAFNILTGEAPYTDLTPLEVANKKLSGKEDWQNRLDDSFTGETRDLISKMTAMNVEERYQNHGALLVAIDSALESIESKLENTVVYDFSSENSVFFLSESNVSTLRSGEVDPRAGDGDSFEVDHDSSYEVAGNVYSQSTRRRARWKSSIVRWVLLLSFPVLLLGGLGYLLSSPGRSAVESMPMLQPDFGQTVRSFNGLKLDYSKFKLKTGFWSVEKDSEGGNVLAGNNCRVVFPCRGGDGSELSYFRYSIGVDINENLDVEIVVRETESHNSPILVSLNPEGVQIQRRTGDRVRELSSRMPWGVTPGENTGYTQIAIDCDAKVWRVKRDSNMIGTLKKPPTQAPMEIEVMVNGRTLFESPEVTPLVPIDEETETG